MVIETDSISRLLNERNTALNQIDVLVERISALEKVAEAADVEYREQYSYGHTSKDTLDKLFDALDAAGYLQESGQWLI